MVRKKIMAGQGARTAMLLMRARSAESFGEWRRHCMHNRCARIWPWGGVQRAQLPCGPPSRTIKVRSVLRRLAMLPMQAVRPTNTAAGWEAGERVGLSWVNGCASFRCNAEGHCCSAAGNRQLQYMGAWGLGGCRSSPLEDPAASVLLVGQPCLPTPPCECHDAPRHPEHSPSTTH